MLMYAVYTVNVEISTYLIKTVGVDVSHYLQVENKADFRTIIYWEQQTGPVGCSAQLQFNTPAFSYLFCDSKLNLDWTQDYAARGFERFFNVSSKWLIDCCEIGSLLLATNGEHLSKVCCCRYEKIMTILLWFCDFYTSKKRRKDNLGVKRKDLKDYILHQEFIVVNFIEKLAKASRSELTYQCAFCSRINEVNAEFYDDGLSRLTNPRYMGNEVMLLYTAIVANYSITPLINSTMKFRAKRGLRYLRTRVKEMSTIEKDAALGLDKYRSFIYRVIEAILKSVPDVNCSAYYAAFLTSPRDEFAFLSLEQHGEWSRYETSALHLLAEADCFDSVHALYMAGADIFWRNGHQDTVMEVARGASYKFIEALSKDSVDRNQTV